MAGISEGEVAVYDRQLRLWGVQAQQRLLKSRVLIWGLDGSNVEVCKNLVLAGVSLVVRDHREVARADTAFNYFLRHEDLGKNRAASSSPRIQEMNPLCSVTFSSAAPEAADVAKLRKELEGHDVVCASLAVLGWDVSLASSIDAACRELNAAFVLTLSAGELAFFFSDLHEHLVEERSGAQGSVTATPAPAAAPEKVSFPAFGDWLKAKPTDLQKQKVDASVLFVSLVCAFLQGGAGSKASADAADDFETFCRDAAGCVPAIDGLADLKAAYRLLFLEPLVHVASVVGGLLAQEVIKAITKRDPPLLNSVCFNAHTGVAIVELIPQVQQDSKKRKAEDVGDLLD